MIRFRNDVRWCARTSQHREARRERVRCDATPSADFNASEQPAGCGAPAFPGNRTKQNAADAAFAFGAGGGMNPCRKLGNLRVPITHGLAWVGQICSDEIAETSVSVEPTLTRWILL